MIDNRNIRTSNGTIRNVKNRKLRKMKLYKTTVKVVATASIVLLSTLIAAGCIKNDSYEIPEGQESIVITMQVEEGDTISAFADMFYNDDTESVYGSEYAFQDVIKKQNGMKFSSYIREGTIIEIPVIVDKNNPYYLQMLEIQNRISEIESNNLWVKYTVQYGDGLLGLANLASGDVSETYELVSKIASRNGMQTNDILVNGTEMWIMNPELGALKTELNDVTVQLKESLMVSQIKK